VKYLIYWVYEILTKDCEREGAQEKESEIFRARNRELGRESERSRERVCEAETEGEREMERKR